MEHSPASSDRQNSTTNLAHNAGHAKLQPHHHSGPLTIQHYWKPPVVRQWLQGDTIHKESASRQPSRFELLYDLTFAGIIHLLAESAAENHTGLGLAKFILTFYPSYSIWQDVRNYSNIHGADDIKMRLYILVTMLLLYGYSANSTGIELPSEEAGVGEGAETPSFGHEAHSSLQAAVAFYLIAKAIRLFLFIYYAISLRRFTLPLMTSALALVLNAAIYFPLLFVTNTAVIVALPSIAIAVDIATRYVLGLFSKVHARSSSAGQGQPKSLVPAFNFEHLMERITQFVVVIFGELVINCAYVASRNQIGPHSEYGRSALGIVIAFGLIWLYFDADSSRTYIHALRRHWASNVTYNVIHFPLTAAIIIISASLSVIIPEAEAEMSLSWYFHGGVATVLLCIAVLGLMHRSMDQHRSGLLPRSVRLGLRFAAAAFIAVLPLFGPPDTTAWIAVVAGVVSALVIVETLGKLGSVRVDMDGTIQEGQRHAKSHEKMQKQWARHEGVGLTETEKGEEDVGIETELGDMESKEIHPTQRLAYAA